MTEHKIQRALSQDLSLGTEAFRDKLLERCLAVLGDAGPDPVECAGPEDADDTRLGLGGTSEARQ